MIRKTTGIPIKAVARKKFPYPKAETMVPEYPPITFGKRVINELKIAY